MYLSDRDLKFAVETKQLIVDPPPAEYDTTSIDLHLDRIDRAKVWNVKAFKDRQANSGNDPWLHVGKYNFRAFSRDFFQDVPTDPQPGNLVYRHGDRVVLASGGFFLWQTREVVGTPEVDPRLICFINGKSSMARTGLLVHITQRQPFTQDGGDILHLRSPILDRSISAWKKVMPSPKLSLPAFPALRPTEKAIRGSPSVSAMWAGWQPPKTRRLERS